MLELMLVAGFATMLGAKAGVMARTLRGAGLPIMRRPVVWLLCGMTAAPVLLQPAACAAAPASGDAVLLASTAPGYALGMVVATTDRLRLPDGASATLLLRSGQMLQIRGPFEGTLGGARNLSEPDDAAALASAFRIQGIDATVIGGTRAFHVPSLREAGSDVQVDPQRSGTYCLHATDSVWIGRPDASNGQLALRRHGSARAVAWPPRAIRIEWPDDLPIADGDRFEVVLDGAAKATIVFRVVDGHSASDVAWMTEGILRGCRDQFDTALRQIAEAAVPPELWVSSDHGRHPSYHPGEPILLTVQPNIDGYLYCVRARDTGGVWTVFPAGALDGARLRGDEALEIPGHRLGTTLRAGPRGTERIRCWLADHDISPELPRALLDPPDIPLPDRIASGLDPIFKGVGGVRISNTELTVHIE